MKRKKVLALFCLFLVMVFPQTVFAEDFTLLVPVKISNLHNQVSGVQLGCSIFSSELGKSNSNVSRGKVLDISSGNIDTVVELKFDPAVNVDPTRVDSYQCTIYIRKDNLSSQPYRPDSSQCINHWATNAYRCGAPGTIVRTHITGSIP